MKISPFELHKNAQMYIVFLNVKDLIVCCMMQFRFAKLISNQYCSKSDHQQRIFDALYKFTFYFTLLYNNRRK